MNQLEILKTQTKIAARRADAILARCQEIESNPHRIETPDEEWELAAESLCNLIDALVTPEEELDGWDDIKGKAQTLLAQCKASAEWKPAVEELHQRIDRLSQEL